MNYEELLEFSVALAVRLQRCGAETYRVEETILRIMEAYGQKKIDVFVIPSCIIAGLETEDGQVFTKVRRVQGGDSVLDGIERYSALCRRLCAEKPAIKDAKRMLDEADKSVRHYKIPVFYIAMFLIAAGFGIFFNGTLLDALAAGICGIMTGLCIRFMGFLHANPFFKTLVGGFVIGFISHALAAIGLCNNADVASIGAIMILVPGFLFTNSLRDIIYGDTMSGVNRLVQVLIIAIALVVGTSTAVAMARGLFGSISGSEHLVMHGIAIQCLAGMVGTLGFGLMLNIHGSGIILCLCGSIVTWFVCSMCAKLGMPEASCYLAAASAASFYAEIMARIRKYPATSYLTAALVPLIPGAGIYYTMDMVTRGDITGAWAKGTATAAIAGMIAVGVLLVSTAFRMWGVWRKKQARLKESKLSAGTNKD